MLSNNKLNNPRWEYMLVNLLLMWITFHTVVAWFPFVTADPLDKYLEPYLTFIPLSFLCGIAFRKYHSFRVSSLKNALKSTLKADLLALLLASVIILIIPKYQFSIYAFLAFVAVQFLFETVLILVYYAFRYAAKGEREEQQSKLQNRGKVLHEDFPLNEKTAQRIERLVQEQAGKWALQQLKQKIRLTNANTLVVDTSSVFNIQNLQENRFSTIVNLAQANNIRGINNLFIAAHDRLPYEGFYVGCFQSKSQYKKMFLKKYPWCINYVLYSFDYVLKRLFPKWGFTREFYFWLTNGRQRVLTKAEIFGRLYACGYHICDEFKANGLIYFIAQKKNEPHRHEIINYGPIVRLNRIGKNGRVFKFYKFRTMHPYSEFLQPYIYEKNSLQEGGKFNHDIRVTTMGRIMRKYWLDELPMLMNFIKRDMKLIGVRPISKHYFSLYPKELQEKRIKVKPGLLPPFYVDMPKTLDEIVASEMRYLDAYLKSPIKTDVRYFFGIIYNIFFKCARSK